MLARSFIVAIAALASVGCAAPADSQGPARVAPAVSDSALEAQTRDVAARLRCPVCQGLSLQDSPSELSQEMRDVVRDQLRTGKTPVEVEQYFVARYGEWILMEPETHGFNWVVYLLPWLVLLGGAGVMVAALRRWTGRDEASGHAEGNESASQTTVI